MQNITSARQFAGVLLLELSFDTFKMKKLRVVSLHSL